MAKWVRVKLSELGEIVGGATPSTSREEYYHGNIPWLTPKDLAGYSGRYISHGARNITQEGLESCSARILPPGTVLFSSRAPIGYVAIAQNEVCTNQGFKSVVPNKNVDSRFLYYLLKYNKDKIEALGSGTTFKEVSGTTMKNVEVVVPEDIATQRRIAAILSALDDKIELNNKINANLERQAQALFKAWFVEAKPSVSFTSLVRVLGGGTPKTNVTAFWEGAIPFFTPKDAHGVYTLETEKSLTDEGLAHCNSCLFPINTVFVTARGTVGKLALAGRPMAMNQSCYALLGKEGYGQYFVYHLAQCVITHLKHKASGAVFDAIVIRDFESEFVPDIKPSEAANFELKVKPLYEAILRNYEENCRLSALRDMLLRRLILDDFLPQEFQ